MSAQEHAPPVESRSSVAIVLNANGEAQGTVKAYVGDDYDTLVAARENAMRIFEATVNDLKAKGLRP